MPWENRKNARYFYENTYRDGKRVKVYRGRGEEALAAAERESKNAEDPRWLTVVSYLSQLEGHAIAVLKEQGFHRPNRGPLRRKRYPAPHQSDSPIQARQLFIQALKLVEKIETEHMGWKNTYTAIGGLFTQSDLAKEHPHPGTEALSYVVVLAHIAFESALVDYLSDLHEPKNAKLQTGHAVDIFQRSVCRNAQILCDLRNLLAPRSKTVVPKSRTRTIRPIGPGRPIRPNPRQVVPNGEIRTNQAQPSPTRPTHVVPMTRIRTMGPTPKEVVPETRIRTTQRAHAPSLRARIPVVACSFNEPIFPMDRQALLVKVSPYARRPSQKRAICASYAHFRAHLEKCSTTSLETVRKPNSAMVHPTIVGTKEPNPKCANKPCQLCRTAKSTPNGKLWHNRRRVRAKRRQRSQESTRADPMSRK